MVENLEIDVRRRALHDVIAQRDSLGGAGPLLAPARAGMVDEDVTHHARGDGEEMRAISPVASGRGEPHVGFVDQLRGLERVIGAFRAQQATRDAPVLSVQHVEQLPLGSEISLAPPLEQERDLRRVGVRHVRVAGFITQA